MDIFISYRSVRTISSRTKNGGSLAISVIHYDKYVSAQWRLSTPNAIKLAKFLHGVLSTCQACKLTSSINAN